MLTDSARAVFESRLAAAFMGAMHSHELLALLGVPPDVHNIPAAYWAALDERLVLAIEPVMVEMAKASALGLGGQAGILESVNYSLVNERAANWASSYTYDLVAGIDATTRTRLGQLVSGYYKTPGQDLQALAAQIAEVAGPDRSSMIAITETTRAAAEGEQALVDEIRAAWPDANVVGIWLTSRDEWVCPICKPLNGVRDDGDGNFTNPDDGEVYRIPGHPNCLTGDSLVSPVGGIAAVSKRSYDGEVVVIRTASGNHLTCTPNHPVLTYSGWVAAGALDEFSYVVSRGGGNRVSSVNHNGQDVPARIEEIAEAFGRARGVTTAEVKTAAPDFHGDGRGSEVAVIWTDSFLRDRLDATFGQHLSEFALGRRDVQAPGLDGYSALDLFGHALRPTSGGLVGGLDLRGAALGRHLRPLERLGRAVVAHRDAGLEQVPANRGTLDTQGIGQRLLRFSGQVAASDFASGQQVARGWPDGNTVFLQPAQEDTAIDAQLAADILAGSAGSVFADQVISIKRDFFHGFVFNLETTTGAYVADGILTHNCRCARGTLIADLPNPEGA